MLVEPLAEAVGDPLLEVLLLALGLERGPQVGEAGADELDRAELAHDVHAVERVLEELAVPEDPRLARALQELLLHDLVPELVDLVALGEEAVAAEVEPVAVADLGLGDAADLVLRLEHDHGHATLREQVAGGQARRATAEHRDGPAVATLVVGGVPGRIEFNGRHVHHHARFPARVLHLLITANRP